MVQGGLGVEHSQAEVGTTLKHVNKSRLHPLLVNSLTLLYRVKRLWWRFRRPVTHGVKALVMTKDRRVLLVEHTYQAGYHLPGGGVKHGEQALQAAVRELREETDLDLASVQGRLLGRYENFSEFKRDHVSVFVFEGVEERPLKPQFLEIREALFFPIEDLPCCTTAPTRRRIKEALGEADVSGHW